MRKFAFLVLCLLTFYLAGMYRYLTLAILACLELAALPVLFLVSRYLKNHLSVEALQHGGAAVKEASYECGVRVNNTGRLPVGSFRIRIECGYEREGGCEVKYVYGCCGRGETEFCFEISGRHCGLLHLRMERLSAYDYLSLFCSSKKIGEELRIAVFPPERELAIELPSLCNRESRLLQEQIIGQGQESRGEIRQLREYREEDSRRHIHWNQSAKTGQLWVKEYERESEGVLALYLNLNGLEEASAHRLDCFYELLSALILGLLKKTAAVRVSWHNGQRMCTEDVGSAAQCRDILAALYRVFRPAERRVQSGQARSAAEGSTKRSGAAEYRSVLFQEADLRDGFTLNAELGWYWRDSLVFQFSEENLRRQMEGRTFVV